MIPTAYKVNDILSITKVYPIQEDTIEIMDLELTEQSNPSPGFDCCNGNTVFQQIYNCNKYAIVCSICIPCITTNLCIYFCCFVCKCRCR